MTSMLKISDAAAIAFHSMIFLTVNNNKLITVPEIAESFDISENHLSKVLQRLVKAALVESVKGPKGGFKLAKHPGIITFLDIYEAIDGIIENKCCLLGKKICSKSICIMDDLLNSTNKQIKNYFKNKKLSDFLGIESEITYLEDFPEECI